ncbi:helix-turn-helix transcriptional regulator [Helicobacter sp. 13S00477-4]|uniref:helix-turn-helix domain-containing protein n=1 Tax=Helicobacter sp. 13S00477-4 TaxID=1905759 RepID=UPI000BA69203|nr:helix-turn-helix transcriptional regulator [Helicobacter sp. 13S00477-4]PAF50437.1 transcriptional regulator [Helicobacter sp. 13S00477-4]
MEKEMNLIKRVCQELNISQKELAEELEIPQSTISRWANDDIPKMAVLYFELLFENKALKMKLQAIKNAREIINSL